MHKAVIFDLSEVLLTGLKGTWDPVSKLLSRDLETVKNEIKSEGLASLFHGEISEREYWQRVLRNYKWDCGVDQLISMVRQNFREIPGTRQVITRVKQSGYRIGLLSVHAREWVEYCEGQFCYHNLFDVIQYSYQVGMSKPDPRVFHRIAQDLDVNPTQCVFVDDMNHNVEAARDLGMTSLLFQSPEQLTAELNLLLSLRAV